MIRRLIAYAIDWYIMSFFMNVILVISYYFSQGKLVAGFVSIEFFEPSLQILLLMILSIFFILYTCVFPLIWNGQTLGKKIVKIKTYSFRKLSMLSLLIRNFIGMILIEGCFNPLSNYIRMVIMEFVGRNMVKHLVTISMIIGLLSLICMVVTKKKRMLHDLISNTYVDMV